MTSDFRPPQRRLTLDNGYPGRGWEVKLRDRIAWRVFALLANPWHAHAVWTHFHWGRDATTTTWGFGHSTTVNSRREGQ